MAVSNVDAVAQLYVGYFGRAPDPSGFQGWVDQLNSGVITIVGIANNFANSQEARSKYPYIVAPSVSDPGAFVDSVYQNVLNRPADTGGRNYWVGLLQAYQNNPATASTNPPTGLTPGQFIQSFIDTINKQTGGDATTLANKVAGGEYYLQQILAKGAPYQSAQATNSVTSVGFDSASLTASKAATDSYATGAAGGGVAGSTFTLTTGVDSGTAFVGTNGNDTFNAAVGASNAATFTSLDSIDGAAGNDTLNITASGAFTTPTGAKVANIETINFANSTGGTTLDTTTYTGVNNLNVTNAAGAATVTAGGTTAISVSNVAPGGTATTVNGGSTVTVATSGAGVSGDTISVGATTQSTGAVTVVASQSLANGTTSGAIGVKGGTSVTVNSNFTAAAGVTAGQGVTGGDITVTGTGATSSVTVSQTAAATAAAAVANGTANTTNVSAGKIGVTDGKVTINDANAGTAGAGTISTVSLTNYGASSAISSPALTTLSLSGAGGTLGLTEGGSTAATNTTLTLNLNGKFGAITDNSAQYKTVNAALGGDSTLTSFTDAALRTLALSGTGVLSLTTVNTALTAITLAGAAGLKSDISSATGVTSLDASGTTGAVTVTLNGTVQSFKGGSGRDVITIGADATKTITLGSGSTDQVVLTADGATYTAANFGTNVTGYEQLGINTATAATTYDLSKFAPVNLIEVYASGATSTTFNKVTAGTNLQLDAATASIVYNTSDTNGAAGSVSVNLKGAAVGDGTTSGYITTALTLQDANGVGIGNVTINSDATVFQGRHTITTLTDSALSKLAITGTGGLTITNAATTQTALAISDNGTGVTAAGAPDGIVTLTSTGNALGNLSYSGSHAFTIGTLVDNVANLSITNANTGTTGVLTISGHTNSSTASGGLTLNGSVAYSGSSASTGSFNLTAGSDNSNITFAAASTTAASTATVGNGTNLLTFGSGNDTISVGTGQNGVTAGTGADKLTFGTHAVGVVDNITQAAGDSGNFSTPGANTVGTTTFDVVTGFKAGDTISTTGQTLTGGTTVNTVAGLAQGNNTDYLVRGTYTASTNTFVGSATGTDSLYVYDDTAGVGVNQEAIVLVGYVAGAALTHAAGVTTLT